MYNDISNDAKAALKANVVTTTARITLTSDNTVIDGDNLQNITITDQCYENGIIVGTAMCKEVEIELINNSYDLADEEFLLEVGVLLPNETYEYIPYGNFIVKEYQKIISSGHYKLIAYDYMDKFNKTFIDTFDYSLKYTCDGEESGDYYLTYNENNYYFTMPTVEEGDTLSFNINELKLYKGTTEIVTSQAGTGTLLDFAPLTLQKFYENVASLYNVEVESQLNLPNADFAIYSKPYFDNMSGRVVLSRIAEMMGCFAKINRDNKLEMKLKTTTSEKFSRAEMNNSLERDNLFGPVNVVALRLSQIEGENVTKRDEESIEEYGETTLQISDNPFVYTEALRLIAIDDIYDQVDGFSYYPTIFNGKLIYLDCGDEVEVQDMDTDSYYKTIILKQVLKIPSTRNSKFENKALTATGLEYQYTSEQVRKNRRTEYLVNKENQTIQQLIESQQGAQTQLNDITQNLETTTNKITQVESETNSKIEELQTSIAGVTNTIIQTGGNNIFYYAKEFWTTDEGSTLNLNEVSGGEFGTNTVSGRGYIFDTGNAIQEVEVLNDTYTISFRYKKTGSALSNVSVKINGIEYPLEETRWTVFTQTLDITTNHVNVEFVSDTDDALYVADLIGNIGEEAQIWTQNPNETRTDTVKIGKGIEVRSSISQTYTKIDADGTRVFNLYDSESPVAEFTPYGMRSKELRADEEAQLAGLLFKKVGTQTWISSLL